MNKIKLIAILSSLFIIIITYIFVYSNDNKQKLKKIGYNNLEINEILKLSDKEINTITNYSYNENFILLIKSDEYNKEYLNIYLNILNKYPEINYLNIVKLINNKNFNSKNIDKYLNLLSKYNNIEGIIIYVNNYDDLELNSYVLELVTKKYFIKDYLDRYLNYYKINNKLNFDEIVAQVNSNLDYTFYDDSKPTDLSKGMHALINKYNYLDKNFIPDDLKTVNKEYSINNTKLNKIALENFINMADSAKKENLIIKITTAYRNYNFQNTLYTNYVKTDGKEMADTYSARPGYSEHQFGYSVDLTNKNYSNFDEFEYSNEYKWLKDNAHKYGFILRYPKDKEYITGYQFESWHYRYVGTSVATYIYENDITYEEYYAYFLR